ncbi:MAG: trimethylamine methyltransferase family protein [Pseudomonadota bacterium]
MARRARAARTREAAASAVLASPYIQRSLPFFDVLDEEKLTRIDAQVDWLLENIGIAFRDDPEALRIWREGGVEPTGEYNDLIRADARWIRELCAKAPSEFTQIARNPDRSVVIGGRNQVFAPIYGAPFVRDLEGGRRYGAFDDFEKLVKLAYMHPNLHHTGFVVTEPTDIPVSKRHLDVGIKFPTCLIVNSIYPL